MGYAIASVVGGMILLGPRGAALGFIAWLLIANHDSKK